MALNPVLNFNGDAKEAFEFYAATFCGEIAFMMNWGTSPMAAQVPSVWHDKILIGRIVIAGRELVGGDAPPGGYHKPQGISLQYEPENIDAAQRIFAALADGGTVTLPLQQTFWSPGFGMVTDRFGIPWEISCE